MLILPLIDLLILSGTGMLVVGFLLKAIAVTTVYRPSVMGFSSMDFVLLAAVCWGMALTLAARSWVRLNEPRLVAAKREQMQARLRAEALGLDREREANGTGSQGAHPVEAAPVRVARNEGS